MKSKIIFSPLFIVLCAFFSFAQTTIGNQDSEPALVELLQNGESYSIEITSVGCFGGTRQTITLSKVFDTIRARWQENYKELTENDVSVFIAFEKQLRKLKMGGCSTVDTYILRYGNETFQTSDGTCSWNGYRQILNILG